MSAKAKVNAGLPVISLWNPWAIWVAKGWKTIETRRHTRFASLVGRRIGIHASLKWDNDAWEAARPYLSLDNMALTRQYLKVGGAIICTAQVVRFDVLCQHHSQAALIDCGSVRRYGLFLADIQPIEAIPCLGKQGIWYYNGEVRSPQR